MSCRHAAREISCPRKNFGKKCGAKLAHAETGPVPLHLESLALRLLASSAATRTAARRAGAACLRRRRSPSIGPRGQVGVDDNSDRFVPGRDALMAGRCAPLGGVAAILAVHAEVHVIGIVVVQYDFFESVVEVVLQDFLIVRGLSPGSARAAAAGPRTAPAARISRFAWRVRPVRFRLGLFGRPFVAAWLTVLAVRSASSTSAAATTTAAGARFAVFVRRLRGSVLGIRCIHEFNLDRLFAPGFDHFRNFFRSAIGRRFLTLAALIVASPVFAGQMAFGGALDAGAPVLSAIRCTCSSGEPKILCQRLTPKLGGSLGSIFVSSAAAGGGGSSRVGRGGSSRSRRGVSSRPRREESARSPRGVSSRPRRGRCSRSRRGASSRC